MSGKTAALESLPPLIFTARLAWGKRKEAGHYSGLLRTTLKFFAGCTPNNEIRITPPAVLACHQLWLQAGNRRLSEFFENPFNLLAVDCGRAFRPDDKMGAGDFFYSTGSCAAARFVLVEQPYRQKIKAVFPSRHGDHGQWHHFDSYHQSRRDKHFLAAFVTSSKTSVLGIRFSSNLGFPFSCAGWISTLAAPGKSARTTSPEPSPGGCIPSSECGDECFSSTKLWSSAGLNKMVKHFNRTKRGLRYEEFLLSRAASIYNNIENEHRFEFPEGAAMVWHNEDQLFIRQFSLGRRSNFSSCR